LNNVVLSVFHSTATIEQYRVHWAPRSQHDSLTPLIDALLSDMVNCGLTAPE